MKRVESKARPQVPAARVEAVKQIRALRRRMNLRVTQAEIRRAITRGQI
jgi:hypothetical protein